jgi:hypothetical protein
MTPHWENLVSETQFATELTVLGLRKLASVPVAPWANDGSDIGYDQSYPLHVGLHAYTNGLERLCKLTIACHGYVAEGSFPVLKSYGHRLGHLLDTVDHLDMKAIKSAREQRAARPLDDLDPGLTEELERFANGSGRYEHLDSLVTTDSTVRTNEVWLSFCTHSRVSPHVKHIIAMREAVITALRELCTDGDLEAAGFAFLEHHDERLYEASVGVMLRLHAQARWVGSVLDFVTYYTHRELPLLGEVVQILMSESDAFFQYAIAEIEDEYITEEELHSHIVRMAERPPGDDIDPFSD